MAITPQKALELNSAFTEADLHQIKDWEGYIDQHLVEYPDGYYTSFREVQAQTQVSPKVISKLKEMYEKAGWMVETTPDSINVTLMLDPTPQRGVGAQSAARPTSSQNNKRTLSPGCLPEAVQSTADEGVQRTSDEGVATLVPAPLVQSIPEESVQSTGDEPNKEPAVVRCTMKHSFRSDQIDMKEWSKCSAFLERRVALEKQLLMLAAKNGNFVSVVQGTLVKQ